MPVFTGVDMYGSFKQIAVRFLDSLTVSININDDVYLDAFQNLTMKSYGEAVDLKSKILNDKGLLINYIKDGSDLSMQGRVELFDSHISKKIG